MFTGIVTHTAKVSASPTKDGSLLLTFGWPKDWPDLQLGESIAMDGVCLTVSDLKKDSFDCFVMPETLSKTTFGGQLPKVVNLERSLTMADRFGGHFVQGHIDARGKIGQVDRSQGYEVWVEFPAEFGALVIPKGSIAINGVSLTVAAIEANKLKIALIPHTLEHTTLGSLKSGDNVNLEFDMLGKYIVKAIEERRPHAKS
ncbi:MAG TPA: riboflavin synthase [Candidatus Saccharimonadales bacterium]|nr:riboflavin synthase [Candidatus Saccharimonadales bacterium]